MDEPMSKGRLNAFGFGRFLVEKVHGIVRKGPTYDELVTGRAAPAMTSEMRQRAATLRDRPRQQLPARPLRISED
jgi:hypothetical protein